jgi:hypothetical protein
MSERKKPHNGRDKSGNYRVRQEDVEDLRTEPEGERFVADDVKLGGAVADVGPTAGQRGEHIQELVDENREIVDKTAEHNRGL